MLPVTDELWIIDVSSKPTSVAIKGFLREPRRFTTSGTSFIQAMELDIVLNPKNSTPKPMMISANFLIFSFDTNMAIMTPTRRMSGAYADKLKDTSCDVIVVPILAPKITPAA